VGLTVLRCQAFNLKQQRAVIQLSAAGPLQVPELLVHRLQKRKLDA
jgi:hypothetical protein